MAKRQYFRAFARQPANLSGIVASELGGWRRAVRIRDIGLAGARIELMEGLPQGAVLRLELELPGQSNGLVLNAEVAWSSANPEKTAAQAGLKFVDLT
ncbi:MAG TPA: PilZ domain-containing protein, partial [Polyangiaceae bacterium]